MPMPPKWKIYYGPPEQATFKCGQGKPWDVPSNVNVQCIAVENQVSGGFGLVHGKDAYFWRDDIGWNGCDYPGLMDYLMFHKGPKVVLFGRSIRDQEYWGIVKRASEEGLG